MYQHKISKTAFRWSDRRTDKTLKYSEQHDIELYYNAVSDVYVVRVGCGELYFDYKYQAEDAYYDAIEDANS